MELALSLGDSSKPFRFLDKGSSKLSEKDLGSCMAPCGGGRNSGSSEKRDGGGGGDGDGAERRGSSDSDPSLQLDLLPFSPVPRAAQPSPLRIRFPWLTDNLGTEPGSGWLDVNRLAGVAVAEEAEEGAALSSPNSAASSFPMDFGIGNGRKRDLEAENERTSSRASDDEENGSTRKKLRLSKEQSAFLEESFKEHNTLNPKQKLALAKQLNLRPRQVEVWFQNRRARTKLKQTEVDCEYLKRCCESLTEENRRLQKELQELRALKTSQPFYMQLPATTLTMCPSCERVATTTTTTAGNKNGGGASAAVSSRPKLFPFSALKPSNGAQNLAHGQAHKAAS